MYRRILRITFYVLCQMELRPNLPISNNQLPITKTIDIVKLPCYNCQGFLMTIQTRYSLYVLGSGFLAAVALVLTEIAIQSYGITHH